LLFEGCDWSDQWLDVAVIDRSGAVLGETRIVYAEDPDPVARYREFLAPLGRRWRTTVTGIEDVNILFASSLAASGMDIVHVDPARVARHRAARAIPKTDRADARLIASMTLAGEYRSLVAHSPQAEALRVVAHAHRAAVADRVEALHCLRAALMRIWPAAVSAWPASVGGLHNPQARAVLAAAPSPRAAAGGRRRNTWQQRRSLAVLHPDAAFRQSVWMAVPKALRSERALAGRSPHRGRWGAGGVGTCVGAACRGFPRNPVESQRPGVVGSCSMLR
jgi:hypothetical protein